VRLRSFRSGLLVLIPVIPLLVLTAAQCAWVGDTTASAAPGIASLRTSQVPQVREEVGGGEIDLSTSATVTAPTLLQTRHTAHRPMRPEADTEVASLAHPLHRRILPASSDEAG
jgi:hypothetical protein